jgi:hypothetical protein
LQFIGPIENGGPVGPRADMRRKRLLLEDKLAKIFDF